MKEYVATGKDVSNECCIKVVGDTDEEAFLNAKKRIPVVSKLDRVEPDGTLTNVEGLPFDDLMATELLDHHQLKREMIAQTENTHRTRKLIMGAVLLIVLVKGCGWARSLVPSPPPSQPIPVRTP